MLDMVCLLVLAALFGLFAGDLETEDSIEQIALSNARVMDD
jgi:hypothetical protein